jgi:hypothetical protein
VVPTVAGEGRDTSPIKVGVTYINNDATSSALGVDDPSTISKKSVIRALIQGLNLAGGVAGRRLVPVEYEWNSQQGSWSDAASQACARFTQDNKVAVVLDNAFGLTGGFRTCVQRAGVFVIQSGPEGDGVASRAAALHANSTGVTVDRGYGAVLQGSVASGYLGKTNHLGVMVEGCPENLRAWQQVLKPSVARLGLRPAEEASVDCTNSFSNAAPAASAVNNAILRFRRLGVDRVMFISDNESVLLLLWATSASSQGWRPGYLLSSGSQAQALRTQVPQDQWPQFRGVGDQPFGDTDENHLEASDRRCVQLVKRAGLSPAVQLDYALVLYECGPFLLLDAALRDSSGSTSDLRRAIDSLGTSFAGPGLVRDATRFGPRRYDGPELFRAFAYVTACQCIRYSGPPFSERNP